jgi:hypothetical protein
VAAAVDVRGEVVVVGPVGAVAGEPVVDALLGGGDAGRILVADEGDTGRTLDDGPTVVGRGPRVAVGVGGRRSISPSRSSLLTSWVTAGRVTAGRVICSLAFGVVGPLSP